MLLRGYGYYLVRTECSKICLATMWCTLNASNSSFVCEKPLAKQPSNALQLTQNGSSLCYPFTCPLMPNKNEL